VFNKRIYCKNAKHKNKCRTYFLMSMLSCSVFVFVRTMNGMDQDRYEARVSEKESAREREQEELSWRKVTLWVKGKRPTRNGNEY